MAEYEDEMISSARSKAEARRRRILESSQRRMGVVTGEVAPVVPSTTDSGVEEDATPSTPAAPEESDLKASSTSTSSGSSRLAQMRRRRFKKAGSATPEVNVVAVEPPVSGTTPEVNAAVAPSPILEERKESVAEIIGTSPPSLDNAEVGKKYMGVARKRRQKLAEKKKHQEEKVAAEAKVEPRGKPTKKISSTLTSVTRTAIFIELLTVLLLFLSGLDIGLQQPNNTTVIPVVKYGLSVKAIAGGSFTGQALDPSSRLLEEYSQSNSDADNPFDEFSAPEELPAKIPNNDPFLLLFGLKLDLDDFTGGTGIIMAFARVAVSIHRYFLRMFYTPIAVMKSILSLPKTLMGSPPIFFILSVFLRRAAKAMGGGIPPEVEEDDMKTMVLNYVKGFVSGSFPRVAWVIEVLGDVRDDMYIMVCGLLLGMALPLEIHMGGALLPGGEEL